MSTISRWVIPCFFTDGNHKTSPIEFDLTDYLKIILSNEVWNRKFNYGSSYGLKNTEISNIKCASVVIYPRFISGYVDTERISMLIEENCGKLPNYLRIGSYKEWSFHNGLAIVKIEYINTTANIPTKKDFTDFGPNFKEGFIDTCHQHFAILKELSTFFITGLHLSFPTTSVMETRSNPIVDGFFQISSLNKTYAVKKANDSFMHEILIETNKLSNVETNLKGLAAIWHYNLWPIKRYLFAVKSDQVTMDNLNDLIFALEGLFEKSTSSEQIKTMCLLQLCSNAKEAKSLKEILDAAFRIRNDIAHGERSYESHDYIKVGGKEILAEKIYWKMKTIVTLMIIKAIDKLLKNEQIKNLRFNNDDFIELIFSKR